MLDQNTDRMWYVIGAVLIGAAIIFGMNTLMPETFASVGGNFTTMLNQTTSIMDEFRLGPNLIDQEDYYLGALYGNTAGTPFSGTSFRILERSATDMVDAGTEAVYFVRVKPNSTYRIDIDGDTHFRRIVEFGALNLADGEVIDPKNPKQAVKDHPRYDYFKSQSTYEHETLPETHYLGFTLRTNDGSLFDSESFSFSVREIIY